MNTKLAILTSRFPYPLEKGDKLRLFEQLKVLAPHFEIHLFTLAHEIPKKEWHKEVLKYCAHVNIYIIHENLRRWNLGRYMLGSMPLQIRYFYDKATSAQVSFDIDRLRPDFIHVHLLRMLPYARDLKIEVPMSIDYMDAMVMNDLAGQRMRGPFLRLLKGKERRLIKRYERESMDSFSNHFLISKRDRNAFASANKDDLQILSNGVDMNRFCPNPDVAPTKDVIFCGNLGYPPNLFAAQFIMNDIAPLLEGKVLIAGADASPELLKSSSKSVEIRGFQQDIRCIYESGKIMIIPVFNGSGQQNKALEAMASGLPCIMTTFVNEALGAEEGSEVLIADDAETFVLHINDLLSHPEKRKKLGRNARAFVEKNFSWKANTEILITTIKKATNE